MVFQFHVDIEKKDRTLTDNKDLWKRGETDLAGTWLYQSLLCAVCAPRPLFGFFFKWKSAWELGLTFSRAKNCQTGFHHTDSAKTSADRQFFADLFFSHFGPFGTKILTKKTFWDLLRWLIYCDDVIIFIIFAIKIFPEKKICKSIPNGPISE